MAYAAAGQACSEAGGKVCDGAGSCVECRVDADCGETTACRVFACTGGKCPASPDLPAGSPCGAGALCDGAGACVVCAPPVSATFVSLDVPHPAPMSGSGSSTLDVAGAAGVVTHAAVTVQLSGSTCPSGDLSLALVAPSGATVDLSSGNGGTSTGNFGGTTFDDAAPPPAVRIVYAAFSPDVVISSAAPERALSRLMGEAPNGTWRLQVANAGATADATLDGWSLELTTQEQNPVLAPVVAASTTAMPIPHGAPAVSTLSLSGLPHAIHAVTVTVSVTHPKSGQLVLELGAPSGKTVLLASGFGGKTPDVFAHTTFDDAAALLLGCVGSGCASSLGPVAEAVPQGALSALAGDDPDGAWSLSVTDTGVGATGKLEGWSISVTPTLCPTK